MLWGLMTQEFYTGWIFNLLLNQQCQSTKRNTAECMELARNASSHND